MNRKLKEAYKRILENKMINESLHYIAESPYGPGRAIRILERLWGSGTVFKRHLYRMPRPGEYLDLTPEGLLRNSLEGGLIQKIDNQHREMYRQLQRELGQSHPSLFGVKPNSQMTPNNINIIFVPGQPPRVIVKKTTQTVVGQNAHGQPIYHELEEFFELGDNGVLIPVQGPNAQNPFVPILDDDGGIIYIKPVNPPRDPLNPDRIPILGGGAAGGAAGGIVAPTLGGHEEFINPEQQVEDDPESEPLDPVYPGVLQRFSQ